MEPSHTKKSLGQHWLRDEATLEEIAQAANLSNKDHVLEVGPGLGTLTNVLAEQAEHVTAVEFDEQLAENLPTNLKHENVTVMNADILDYDFESLPKNYKVVANIPYYLTSNLIRKLLESINQPSQVVLLIQKEVAERIVAGPGNMSILSVSAQHYADVTLGTEVPAELFDPPPKVDSQVVIITPHEIPDIDQKRFFRIVKAGFGEKRKKLSNSLSGGLGIDKSLVVNILEELQLNPNVRAQELGLEDWYKLYERQELG